MAKAQITLNSGSKVTVEGTAEEVASLIARLDTGAAPQSERPKSVKPRKSTAKAGPADLLCELIDGGFFKKPKELGAIKAALEEHGHYYPVTTLSPAMLRLVRKRQLRRIKDKKRWLYVG